MSFLSKLPYGDIQPYKHLQYFFVGELNNPPFGIHQLIEDLTNAGWISNDRMDSNSYDYLFQRNWNQSEPKLRIFVVPRTNDWPWTPEELLTEIDKFKKNLPYITCFIEGWLAGRQRGSRQ